MDIDQCSSIFNMLINIDGVQYTLMINIDSSFYTDSPLAQQNIEERCHVIINILVLHYLTLELLDIEILLL